MEKIFMQKNNFNSNAVLIFSLDFFLLKRVLYIWIELKVNSNQNITPYNILLKQKQKINKQTNKKKHTKSQTNIKA